MDNGLDITRADYKFGYCIFGFDRSPALCHEEPQERKRNGTLRENTEFRAPLPNSINVFMYMKINNFFVDKTRRITKDYSKWTEQFLKERFKKGTFMCVVNEQDSQFPESHCLMVYQDKKKTYFIDLEETLLTITSSLRDTLTKSPDNYNVYQTENYVEFFLYFWTQIGKGVRLEQHYGLLYMGLKIQRGVHLRLHQGKTINSENNTRRFYSHVEYVLLIGIVS